MFDFNIWDCSRWVIATLFIELGCFVGLLTAFIIWRILL